MKTIFKLFLTTLMLFGYIIPTNGQNTVKTYLKRNYPSFICLFVAGSADGFAESLKFHYSGVKRHLNTNDAFFNPDVSWKNKYAYNDPTKGDKFFLSSSALVFTTDGYHAARFVRNSAILTGICLKIGQKQKWYMYFVDFLSFSVCYSAGFNLTYEYLKK
jgi:hypothetical protein